MCAYNYLIVRTSLYSHVDLNLTFNCHTLYILYFIPKTKNEKATGYCFLRKKCGSVSTFYFIDMVVLQDVYNNLKKRKTKFKLLKHLSDNAKTYSENHYFLVRKMAEKHMQIPIFPNYSPQMCF